MIIVSFIGIESQAKVTKNRKDLNHYRNTCQTYINYAFCFIPQGIQQDLKIELSYLQTIVFRNIDDLNDNERKLLYTLSNFIESDICSFEDITNEIKSKRLECGGGPF